jgi:hypothetical protein
MSRVATLASMLVLSAVASQVARAQIDPPGVVVVEAKFDTATEHVLIPVTIGDHVFWCNPDTGFSALIALDQAKAVAAGLPVSPGIPTPDGNPPPPGDTSTTATVTVGGVTFSNHPIILRRFFDEAPDMDCIIGVALLRRFVVEFDYMTPRLILHERAMYRPPPGTEIVPLLFRANPNVPYVDIQMMLPDGSRQPLHVVPDTGASYYGAVLVGAAMARAQSQLASARAITYPDSRITQLLAARPRGIIVGPFTISDPVIAFVEGSLGGGGAIADGALGSGFFRKFTVGFDFDDGKMYLKPNERFSRPHVFDASGAGFILRKGKHVVHQVIPDSVAAKAGIRVGDVLLELDGRAASDLTSSQLRTLLSVDGAVRRLAVERDGRTIPLVLALEKRI